MNNLVERLRTSAKYGSDNSTSLLDEAADRIEALETENDKPITAAMSIVNSHLTPLHDRIEALEAALQKIAQVIDFHAHHLRP